MSFTCLNWHHSRQLLGIKYNDKLYSETEAANAPLSRDSVFLKQPPNSLPSISGTLTLHIAGESVVLPRAVPWTAALLGALGNC